MKYFRPKNIAQQSGPSLTQVSIVTPRSSVYRPDAILSSSVSFFCFTKPCIYTHGTTTRSHRGGADRRRLIGYTTRQSQYICYRSIIIFFVYFRQKSICT